MGNVRERGSEALEIFVVPTPSAPLRAGSFARSAKEWGTLRVFSAFKSQGPRPVFPKAGETRTGHPLVWLSLIGNSCWTGTRRLTWFCLVCRSGVPWLLLAKAGSG